VTVPLSGPGAGFITRRAARAPTPRAARAPTRRVARASRRASPWRAARVLAPRPPQP